MEQTATIKSSAQVEKDLKKKKIEEIQGIINGEASRGIDLPEEVVDHIFSLADDVKLAKIGRLVCKLWNRAACRLLRERACVVLTQKLDENRLNLVKSLLNECISRGKDPSGLPNPFRDIHVVFGLISNYPLPNFERAKFLKLLPQFLLTHDLNVTLVSCKRDYFPMTFVKLNLVLEKVQSTLRYLHLDMPQPHEVPSVFPKPVFQFHNLKHLNLNLSCLSAPSTYSNNVPNEDECEYVRRILNQRALEHITCNWQLPGGFLRVFGNDYVCPANLKCLRLTGTCSEEDMKAVGRITPSESLQDFKWNWRPIDNRNQDEQRLHGLILPFLRRIRCTLKRLEISSFTLLGADFDFPNLEHLEIVKDNACYEASFSPSKFPGLKTIGFEFFSVISCVDDFRCDFVHGNVTSLKIGFGNDLSPFRQDLRSLQDALQGLRTALPNVEALSVHIGLDFVKYKNAKEILYLLNHNFPGIKRLRVGQWCNKNLLIGRYYFSYKLAHALGFISYDWTEDGREINSDGETEDDSDFDNCEGSAKKLCWKVMQEESEDELTESDDDEDKCEDGVNLEDEDDANMRGDQKEESKRCEDEDDMRLSRPKKGKFEFGLGVTHFRELEELRLDSVEDYRPYRYNGRYDRIFRWLTPEKGMTIKKEIWKRCLAKLPKLKTLILGNCEDYQMECEEEFVQELPQLRVMIAPC